VILVLAQVLSCSLLGLEYDHKERGVANVCYSSRYCERS
jgi:hypothetical protein